MSNLCCDIKCNRSLVHILCKLNVIDINCFGDCLITLGEQVQKFLHRQKGPVWGDIRFFCNECRNEQ